MTGGQNLSNLANIKCSHGCSSGIPADGKTYGKTCGMTHPQIIIFIHIHPRSSTFIHISILVMVIYLVKTRVGWLFRWLSSSVTPPHRSAFPIGHRYIKQLSPRHSRCHTAVHGPWGLWGLAWNMEVPEGSKGPQVVSSRLDDVG